MVGVISSSVNIRLVNGGCHACSAFADNFDESETCRRLRHEYDEAVECVL